jgi:hypothetical protein
MKKPVSFSLARLAAALPLACAAALLYIAGAMPGVANAGVLHPTVVSKNPVNYTPVLVPTTAVPTPHIDAIEQLNDTIFAGGLFERVARPSGTPTYDRENFFAFSTQNGVLKSETGVGYTDPIFDGQIWAIKRYGNSVFVGGTFNTVNGISRPRLVKINANTGAVETGFNARLVGGTVWDLKIWNGPAGTTPMLIVGGSMGQKLFALNPATGAKLAYFNLAIADALPGAWGGVSIYKMAINPAGTKLVATGNFQTVQGQSRTRLFMVNLTGSTAALDPWYYPGFAKPCASTHPRRIAYLQGVDFSPDGSYFVVTATGQIPKVKGDIWPAGSATYHTVCDAAGRFNLSNDQSPVWINYTGGDSVWATVATGAAVYVQGHFEWLDNPNGFASQDGGGAVARFGIGAINPVTGKALRWNPVKSATLGGKAFLATSTGLWVGSDSMKFDGEPHHGIAFAPLPTVVTGAGDIGNCLSSGDEATAQLLSDNIGTIFTLGDNAYQSGTNAEFLNCYEPSWGAYKSRTMPSVGDREYQTPGAAGYFNYFGAAAGPSDKGYYSYDLDYWHIIVLNSACERVGGCGSASPMVTWLKSDLAANTKTCTLVYFHHPLFSSGSNGNNTKMRPVWNALYSNRVDVVVSGHDNNYERFAPQQPDGVANAIRGIRQFVVGTGGAALRPFGAIQPNSEVRNADTYGVLRLYLQSKSYDWDFIPQAGGTFTDSGADNCS